MTQRSGLALAVLALAAEEPMHPYRMQQLLRERGKDQVVNVGQRSQLYKTIDLSHLPEEQARATVTAAEGAIAAAGGGCS